MDDDVVFVGASDPSARRSAAPRKRKAPSNLVDLSHFTDAEPLPARAAGAASTSASAAAGLAAAARAAGTALPGAVAQGLAAAQEQALDSDAEEWEPQQGRKKKPKVQKAAAAKKPKAPKAPKEKRGARFSARPSQQIQQRIARALPGSGHRMFLIDSVPGSGTGLERSHKFVVLGATGNAYDVTISCKPTCTCPDALKGNVCKHILFVMLRVLRLKRDDPLVWQKALLSGEVEAVLSGARAHNTAGLQDVVAEDAVRRAYAAKAKGAAGGASGSGEAAAGAEGRRRPIEGEDCPICYEELKAVGEALVWCTTCGNNIHTACFGKWAQAKRSSHNPVTCVCCRTPWPEEGAPKDAAGSSYVNLADVSSAHRQGSTHLHALYGHNAVWIQRNQGLLSTNEAARMWRSAR